MAAEFNKVILLGNLTRDPELRHLDSGTAVARLGLAVNRSYSTRDGDRQEEVCFIDVDVWDRMAENCAEYLRQGSKVLVEGRLTFDQWETESGEKRSKHRVRAQSVQFLGSPRDRDDRYDDDEYDSGGRSERSGGYERSRGGRDDDRDDRRGGGGRDDDRRGGGGGGRDRDRRRERPNTPTDDDDVPF